MFAALVGRSTGIPRGALVVRGSGLTINEPEWVKYLFAELIAALRPKTSGPTPLPRIYPTCTAPERFARPSPPDEPHHVRHTWRESLEAEQQARHAPCLPIRTRPTASIRSIHEPRGGRARPVDQQCSPIAGDLSLAKDIPAVSHHSAARVAQHRTLPLRSDVYIFRTADSCSYCRSAVPVRTDHLCSLS